MRFTKNFAKKSTFLLSCVVVLTTILSFPTHAMFSGSHELLSRGKKLIPKPTRRYTKYPDFNYNKKRDLDPFPVDEESPRLNRSSKNLNFTQKAWWEVKPIYNQIKQHPFIMKLIAGSLSKDIFSFYIQQDYLFLLERAQAMSILSSRAQESHPELARHLADLAEGTKRGAAEIFGHYHLTKPNDKDLIKSPACRIYTEDMLTVTSKGSLQEGLSILVPCALMYQKIGEFADQSSPPTNKYKAWIETYSRPQRRERVRKLITFSNEHADHSSAEKLIAMGKVFWRASQLEHDFWDDAYHQKQ